MRPRLRFASRLLPRALLLLAAGALGANDLEAQNRVPSGYEEGVFDLTIFGIDPTSLPVLVSPRGKFLLPVRALLDPLGVPYDIVADSAVLRVSRPAGVGRASLWWGEPRRLEVTSIAPVDSDDVYVDGASVFVSATRLAELIEAEIDVDVGTLGISVRRDGGFPAQIKLDARQRRRQEALLAGQDDFGEPTGTVPFRARSGAGVLEWSMGGPLRRTSAPSTMDLRGGLGLFGGMLQLHTMVLMGAPDDAISLLDHDASYRRVFPGQRWVQQFSVGNVQSEGAEARPMQGVTLTNAPFVRGLQFGDVAFSRPLPPGWEYEVYEGSRLVGFADDSRTGPMNVPLRYGTTPLRVRLYGPAGEVVESSVSYVIPIEQLHESEWQYAAGAGRCVQGCSGLWYADVRHGLSRRLTVQGGADAQRDSGWRAVRPYGAVSYLPAPGWTASMQARRDAYLRASLQNYTDGHVNGGVTAGLNLPGEGGVSVTTVNDAVLFAQTTLRIRDVFPRLTARAFTLSARVEAPQHGGATQWDLSSSLPIQIGLLDVGVQSDPFAIVQGAPMGPPLVRIAPTVALSQGIFRRLAFPVIRLEAGLQRGRLMQWEGALSLQPGRGFVSIALRHAPGLGSNQLTVGGSYALGLGRVIGRMTRHGDRIDGGYSASGAVAFGSVRRATPLEYGGLGLSGVEGRVFRDLDGDGKSSAGDEPVAGVTVRIGGLVARTDAEGRYSMWNVLPYQPVSVQIDTLSLADPAWVPALPARALRPSPQQFTGIDFALVRTREISGLLVPGSKVATPAGVGLELRDAMSGALHTARTFSDGAFYFSRVRPGAYRLTLAKSSSIALGISAPPQLDVLVAATGSDIVDLPPITLIRSASPSPSP
ncbi:MAG: hypothetical protein ABIP93_12945 [Gemmatimonadaceae bacterium]